MAICRARSDTQVSCIPLTGLRTFFSLVHYKACPVLKVYWTWVAAWEGTSGTQVVAHAIPSDQMTETNQNLAGQVSMNVTPDAVSSRRGWLGLVPGSWRVTLATGNWVTADQGWWQGSRGGHDYEHGFKWVQAQLRPVCYSTKESSMGCRAFRVSCSTMLSPSHTDPTCLGGIFNIL